jgi:hypothetical protein
MRKRFHDNDKRRNLRKTVVTEGRIEEMEQMDKEKRNERSTRKV